MRDDAVLRHALPLGRGLGRFVPSNGSETNQTTAFYLLFIIHKLNQTNTDTEEAMYIKVKMPVGSCTSSAFDLDKRRIFILSIFLGKYNLFFQI